MGELEHEPWAEDNDSDGSQYTLHDREEEWPDRVLGEGDDSEEDDIYSGIPEPDE